MTIVNNIVVVLEYTDVTYGSNKTDFNSFCDRLAAEAWVSKRLQGFANNKIGKDFKVRYGSFNEEYSAKLEWVMLPLFVSPSVTKKPETHGSLDI